MAFRSPGNLATALLLIVLTTHAHGQHKAKAQSKPAPPTGPVTLTPALVESGSPELIRIEVPASAHLEGEWLGHKLAFFHSGSAWYCLAGVDVEAPAGRSTLKITADNSLDLSQAVTIRAAHYTTGSLSVAPKFVEPGPDEKALINAAVQAKERAFAASNARTPNIPLWSGSFAAPVKAQATASFGTRRMFNGKLASIHKGTDFRAATGTPVLAGNSGIVLLAQPLYYEGNCVMVDHGQGLISISMHLSRIDVKPGQPIAKGQQLGLSGATGRVTGPHLHWAIRWQGAMLDPTKLLKMNLSALR